MDDVAEGHVRQDSGPEKFLNCPASQGTHRAVKCVNDLEIIQLDPVSTHVLLDALVAFKNAYEAELELDVL